MKGVHDHVRIVWSVDEKFTEKIVKTKSVAYLRSKYKSGQTASIWETRKRKVFLVSRIYNFCIWKP